MPRYLYSSTLWYSGIFAAAATFDAGRKERRREQWDRVIAEVRQELEQPGSAKEYKEVEDVAEASQSVTQSLEIDGEKYRPFDGLSGEGGILVADNVVDDEVEVRKLPVAAEHEDDIFHTVDPARPRSRYPANTGPELNALDLAPQSLYATEEAKRRAERLRWTPKKLATVQKCAEILQLQFINSLQYYGMQEEAAAAVPDDYVQHVRQSHASLQQEFESKFAELRKIKGADAQLSDYRPKNSSQGETLCQYTQDPLGNFHETAREVNRSLRALFTQRRREEISQATLLAKLAYTLYISPAPPSLDTFNTLLIGLRHINEDYLARKVIITMNETHTRINEVSFAARLEYYTERNDITNFVRLIERIRGKHGGAMLARSTVRIQTEAARKKLLRVTVDGRRGKEEKVIQLPTPTPMVFGAIVKGVLKFAGFDAALSICEGMGKEGWGLCMAGLTPLLKDCADRGDWISGLVVWKQIQTLKIKSDRRLVAEIIGLEAFAAMLRLCKKCDQRETFDNVWRQATLAWKNSTHMLVDLVKRDAETIQERKVEQQTLQSRHIESASRSEVDILHEVEKDDVDKRSWEDPAPCSVTNEEPVPESDPCLEQAYSSPRLRHQASQKPGKPTPTDRPTILLEQQLLGLHPPSYELDEYELRERPMSASG